MSKTTVTPEMAKKFLESNHENQRKLSKSRVTRYAEEIRNEMWLYNGESIIISESGRLIDGQHRLAAILEAGLAIDTVLITDVPDEQDGVDTFLTINTENRSNADALYIAGFKEESSSVGKLMGLVKAFNMQKIVQKPSGHKYNNIEVVEQARQFTEKRALSIINDAKTNAFECDTISLNFWMLMIYVFQDLPKGADFLDAISNCDDAGGNSPVSALLKFFKRHQGTGGGNNISKVKWIAILNTYNSFIKDRTVQNLRINPSTKVIYPAGYPDYED